MDVYKEVGTVRADVHRVHPKSAVQSKQTRTTRGHREPRGAGALQRIRDARHVHQFRASAKTYPRAILGTPATSGYRLLYKMVLRAVPHKPPRWDIC